jgi:histidinol-phosphate aminotransferase
MTKPIVRTDLQSLPAYKAGQKLQPRADLEVFKLSSNENTFPPLPSVLEAINTAAQSVNRYPDPLNTEMISAIAKSLGVSPENIAAGAGSVAVLGHLIQAMAAPGDEVIYPWRSFEAYPIWTQICAVAGIPVALNADNSHNLDAMAAAITSRTKMVFICTPNNPTGNAVRSKDLHEFMEKVPSDVLVVIDEAYADFVTDSEMVSGMDFFNKYENVALLRTFSKAQGLAGMRVGYTVAQPEIADFVSRVSLPFGVNLLAQVAVIASFGEEAKKELRDRVEKISKQRDEVIEPLRNAGWNIGPQHANFFWISTSNVDAIKEACEAAGVAVRPFPEGIRITIGEEEANNRIVKLLTDFPIKN